MTDQHPRIAAIVLAAGMSTRMGSDKLLTMLEAETLIRRVVRSVETSRANPVLVVTGHDDKAICEALASANASIVHNPDFRDGLSTSLRTGIRAVGECDGAIILLGDMPAISSSLINRMIATFDPKKGRAICVAAYNGRRGNPVLFDRRFFPELQTISGDIGARDIVAKHACLVCEIEADDDGCLTDIDSPEDLERFVRRS